MGNAAGASFRCYLLAAWGVKLSGSQNDSGTPGITLGITSLIIREVASVVVSYIVTEAISVAIPHMISGAISGLACG